MLDLHPYTVARALSACFPIGCNGVYQRLICMDLLLCRDVQPASYSLRYNLMPHVGLLTYGEAARTIERVEFPESREVV